MDYEVGKAKLASERCKLNLCLGWRFASGEYARWCVSDNKQTMRLSKRICLTWWKFKSRDSEDPVFLLGGRQTLPVWNVLLCSSNHSQITIIIAISCIGKREREAKRIVVSLFLAVLYIHKVRPCLCLHRWQQRELKQHPLGRKWTTSGKRAEEATGNNTKATRHQVLCHSPHTLEADWRKNTPVTLCDE